MGANRLRVDIKFWAAIALIAGVLFFAAGPASADEQSLKDALQD